MSDYDDLYGWDIVPWCDPAEYLAAMADAYEKRNPQGPIIQIAPIKLSFTMEDLAKLRKVSKRDTI